MSQTTRIQVVRHERRWRERAYVCIQVASTTLTTLCMPRAPRGYGVRVRRVVTSIMQARQSKITYLHHSSVRQKHIGRLEVTMEDACEGQNGGDHNVWS